MSEVCKLKHFILLASWLLVLVCVRVGRHGWPNQGWLLLFCQGCDPLGSSPWSLDYLFKERRIWRVGVGLVEDRDFSFSTNFSLIWCEGGVFICICLNGFFLLSNKLILVLLHVWIADLHSVKVLFFNPPSSPDVYTSPCFRPFNVTLRDLGNLPTVFAREKLFYY